MENVYLPWLRKLSGSPVAHLINSSDLPGKLFHPRHQPIILYLHCIIIHVITLRKIFFFLLIKLYTLPVLKVKIYSLLVLQVMYNITLHWVYICQVQAS